MLSALIFTRTPALLSIWEWRVVICTDLKETKSTIRYSAFQHRLMTFVCSDKKFPFNLRQQGCVTRILIL